MPPSADRLSVGKRVALWRALLTIHRPGRCVLLVEHAGELRLPRSPAELVGCACVICGRQTRSTDRVEAISQSEPAS